MQMHKRGRERLTEGTGQGTQLAVVWVESEDVRVLLANQFLGQVGLQGEVLLTFGQLVPPTLVGEPDEVAEQLKQLSHVPAKPIARMALTRFGLDELIRVLNETRDNYDKAQQAAEQGRKGGEG